MSMVDKKKNKKSAEQMALEIKHSEQAVDKAEDHCRKVLQLCKRVYDKATNTYLGTQQHEIEKVGYVMVENGYETNKIMVELRKRFKEDNINRGVFTFLCKKHPTWVQDKYRPKDSKNKGRGTDMCTSEQEEKKEDESLTPYQREYAKDVQAEYERDSALNDLTAHFTGLTGSDQGRIILETPKHIDWRKVLLDKSYDHMFKLAKRMSPSEITYTLNETTTLMKVLDKFRDLLLEERELREKKEKMSSV